MCIFAFHPPRHCAFLALPHMSCLAPKRGFSFQVTCSTIHGATYERTVHWLAHTGPGASRIVTCNAYVTPPFTCRIPVSPNGTFHGPLLNSDPQPLSNPPLMRIGMTHVFPIRCRSNADLSRSPPPAPFLGVCCSILLLTTNNAFRKWSVHRQAPFPAPFESNPAAPTALCVGRYFVLPGRLLNWCEAP